MSILQRDTTLYHPTEGKRVFLQGDQHPGGAWFNNPDCAPAATSPDVLTALNEANARAATLHDAVDAARAQIEGQAAAHADEMAALKAAHVDELAAKDERIAALEADIETLVQQRDAALAGRAVEQERPGDNPSTQGTSEAEVDEANGKSAFDHDGDGKAGGSKPAADSPDAAEIADIWKQLRALGVEPLPHPRTGVVKLREALKAAQAAMSKAE